MRNLYPPDASKLISILQPGHDEIVVDHDRFCASSGNDLKEVLHSGGIKHLVMAGVVTSGVILSTFTLAADEDYSLTILSDACADPKASLHQELMTNLFPRSASVLTVDQWIASLPAIG
jgi:nicotinamidase-related amidase